MRLDNLTLARKEGWQRFVNTAPRIPPEPLNRPQLEALPGAAFDDYNRQRREWHANLGPIKTPQLAALHEDLWDIVDSNAQDGDKPKGAVAIDAFPGLGKGKRTMSAALTKAAERGEISADRDWSLVADVLVAMALLQVARGQTVDANLVRQVIDTLILPAVRMPVNEGTVKRKAKSR
ncbi:hypothetical protein MSTO_38770 [Mycobacterium stomatepiae]|uniref:Tetracyclin repressor-like C-terminal domain-containing protein n=1 Tax=Mycobacterium stomatepiae TaxID=470076 RepID=A0A7I7QC49_9MYCO|nr:hypothetical protein MSTO_38770 [Mycobacterium stomatepiae]